MTLSNITDSSGSPLGIPVYIHRYIYLGSIILLVVGMSTSTFFTSLPEIMLAANWLLEGDLSGKMKRLWANKAALLLCSFFLLHLIGLLYTSHDGMDYGMEDVRKKLPLFLLPLVFGTSTHLIMDKEKRIIFLFFMLAVTFVTAQGTYMLLTHQLADIHEISPYVDAVRLAMMIVLSIFLAMRYVLTSKWNWISAVLILWMAWLFVFLFIMQSLTEVIVFIVLTALVLGYKAFVILKEKKTVYGIALLFAAVVAIIGSAVFTVHFYHKYFPEPEKISLATINKTTAQGNLYSNYPERYETENGHYVYMNICWPELRQAWGSRSKIAFDSNDFRGNSIRFTLIRYMASKGLKKDAQGMLQMSDADIKAVEAGMPSYLFSTLTSMRYRLYQVFWELKDYRHGGNPSGHSFTQRFEFWKAATGIIKDNPIVGVGTGDVRIAFDNQYVEMNSQLTEQFRLRSHNQWLEIGVAFGILGIVWFALSLIYPGFKTGRIKTYPYFIFWMIFMISICTEDTLETQAGATFYAFFNAFFLFL